MNIFCTVWSKYQEDVLVNTWVSASQEYDFEKTVRSSEKLRVKWNRNTERKVFTFEVIEYTPLQK